MIVQNIFDQETHLTVPQVPSQKFPRNSSGFNHKGWVEDSMSRCDSVYPFQVSISHWLYSLVFRELLGIIPNGDRFGLWSYRPQNCKCLVCAPGANAVNPI